MAADPAGSRGVTDFLGRQTGFALFGTPEGWVSVRQQGQMYDLIHHRYVDGVWQEDVLLLHEIQEEGLVHRVFEAPMLANPDAEPQPPPEIAPVLGAG